MGSGIQDVYPRLHFDKAADLFVNLVENHIIV